MTIDYATATAGVDFRPIVEDDIQSAIRGLDMTRRTPDALIELVREHAKVPMFASAVIVVGAHRRLCLTGSYDWSRWTDAELAVIELDPSQLTRSEVAAERTRRANAPTPAGWLFELKFSRTYTITEGFKRIIRAPSLAEAEAAAAKLASGFDHDCPDDCSEDEGGHFETGDFIGEVSSAEVHRKSEPDYVVLADGQVVEYEA